MFIFWVLRERRNRLDDFWIVAHLNDTAEGETTEQSRRFRRTLIFGSPLPPPLEHRVLSFLLFIRVVRLSSLQLIMGCLISRRSVSWLVRSETCFSSSGAYCVDIFSTCYVALKDIQTRTPSDRVTELASEHTWRLVLSSVIYFTSWYVCSGVWKHSFKRQWTERKYVNTAKNTRTSCINRIVCWQVQYRK